METHESIARKAQLALDALMSETGMEGGWQPLADLVDALGGPPAWPGQAVRLRLMPPEYRTIYLFALLAARLER